MKRNIWIVLLIVIVALLALWGYNYFNSNRPLGRETEQKLDRLMADSMKKYHSPGMIMGVWLPGRGNYVKAAGIADLETGRKMKVTDDYRIGSLTKTFTATVILQLVEEGKIGLNDALDKYVSTVPDAKDIPVCQLLNMTSGLHCYTQVERIEKAFARDRFRNWKPDELVAAAMAAGPDFAPVKVTATPTPTTFCWG